MDEAVARLNVELGAANARAGPSQVRKVICLGPGRSAAPLRLFHAFSGSFDDRGYCLWL
jgi:hypothetical protein